MAVKFKTDIKRGLTLSYHPLELEQKVRKFWETNRIPQKLMFSREEKNIGVLGYVEGPPTLNGVPHVGHARGRVMKDLRYRLRTMQGFYVTFWAGWDCQGLPVELEVEKELGVKNKKELLERVGEERFVDECKKTVMKYYREWFSADQKLGLFMNYDKAYWTYLDGYIEREWQYLKRAYEQNLLGEGYYVVAYCPHCQTSLSNAEVGLGYREVEDPSLFFKLKVGETKNEYFLIWTTMPFTIITNMMLAVQPKAEYARVKVNEEIWILAKARVEPIMQELEVRKYQVLETVLGKELEGKKYEYVFKELIPQQDELDKLPFVHTVVCEDFVDVDTATGVVHLAPGNGEDDFLAAQKRHIPIFVPFDDECRFTAEAGEFAGLFARDSDSRVVEELRKKGLLVSIKFIHHEYPTCWRSHHKLIWVARREYFLWTNKINDKVVKAAEKINYFYESPKKRFLSFLREGKPWCVSRERVWGSPLPIWVCEECKSKILIASKKELLEKSINETINQDFELHKPWIDRLTLKCEKCGGEMKREPFVLDCWHNSGASPYARFSDKEFERYVPVDFLVEAVDQTRGWANSLLLQHIILTGQSKAPYKSFLFYGFVLDDKGRKMSKSLGNVIEVNPLLQQHSADICRFYLLWKCSPVDTMSFDFKELNKRPYQVLNTLYHLHHFFKQNAEHDHFNPKKHTIQWVSGKKVLKPQDHWLLSKLQRTVREVTKKFETCEFNFALSELEEFVINVLSRRYVPMIRRDLLYDSSENINRRLAIYAILWYTLKNLVLIFNPITPFLSEAMYQLVYRELDNTFPESINFESWPVPDEDLYNVELEQKIDVMLQCVSLTHSARQSAQLKRRWPLQKAIVVAPKNVKEALKDLEKVFLELTNIKEVEYLEEVPRLMRRWVSVSDENLHVLLDTHRDEALLGEGLMRDTARRIQALRKKMGFSPTDKLEVVHFGELDQETARLLTPHLSKLRELIRTKKICVHKNRDDFKAKWQTLLFDDKKMYVGIE